MWIVRIALQRPYTFFVLALLILLTGALAITRMAVDILPRIDIPVISVVWSYTGLAPEDMANRVTGGFERALTTTVNDVEHIDSQSLAGVNVTKLFFQPNANVSVALSQVTAIAQTLLRNSPPGTTPPLIMSYDATTVPVIQLALTSDALSEQELFDLGFTFIRPQLFTVPGAGMPFPFGGRQRQVQIDLAPAALRAHGISPQEVTDAVGRQNLIVPAGTQKMGPYEYNVKLNASPLVLDELNDLPLRTVNGATLYVRDVAHVRDGAGPQTNIVRTDGHRAVLLSVQRMGTASTLAVIEGIKARLPQVLASLPPSLKLHAIGDQSVFVRAAVNGVVREGIIAAALTALMILLFLGSVRSTLIITISIPLSVLASIAVLWGLGETINVMTLGGLALAVGILVDDATVAVENINWHLEQGKDVETAILDGAQQIALPALVSTLAICIVFVPMFFLTGVARYLFVPLAQAVVYAMLASYVLSRTLVPTLAKYWLRAHGAHEAQATRPGFFGRLQHGFERRFEALRGGYQGVLAGCLDHGKRFAALFLLAVAASLLLAPYLGENFFPEVDGGQIKLHLRAPTGTRIEETARLVDQVEERIAAIIPAKERLSLTDNIGLPVSGINVSYSNSGTIGPADADILISLAEGHRPSGEYIEALRADLPQHFPAVGFAFLPADIVSQILNFGLPAPIDVQVVGPRLQENLAYARELLHRLRRIPGIVDLRIQQAMDYPELRVAVDRSRAAQIGLTQRDVASDLLVALSGSFQTAPTFWVDPRNGVSYPLVTQAPQYRVDSLQDLAGTPLGSGGGAPQVLSAVARLGRGVGPAVVSHYNVMPVIDLYAAAHGRDLGAVGRDIQRTLDAMAGTLPRGSRVLIGGQIRTMQSSFGGLYFGLAFAILLVYLLIVVNFQSWLDPFIIITALPAALAGIVWMLFLTRTTLSVPALTGAIMCMGVATANSILVVSFARERMQHGDDARTAALAAGYTRLRPVLMTALAMVIGMVPMALGFGEGGEQNAPLGRAVIGGLLAATVATLFFVPTVFSLLRGRAARPVH